MPAIITLAAASGTAFWDHATRLERTEPSADDVELAELGAATVHAFPTELIRGVHRFTSNGNRTNTLLIRGLVPDMPASELTPSTVLPDRLGSEARTAQLALLGVSSLLGAPFTFASLYEGRLVQHVTPVPGQEAAQSSGGSDSFLAWHVEDAWSDDRCDYFALLCLRGDETASTLLAPIRIATIEDRWSKILREPRFVVRPDDAHGECNENALRPVHVLAGPSDDPEICYDAVYMSVRERDDAEGAEALRRLSLALEGSAIRQVLEPGDLLVVDNRRVVHARTSFRPRYDGTDRWLLRTMICASQREHRRRGGRRAIG